MIQIVYDKIVNFCGVTKIPCVIVGSKCDLSLSYVSFLFLHPPQPPPPLPQPPSLPQKRNTSYFSVFFRRFYAFLKKNKINKKLTCFPILAVKLIRQMGKSWLKWMIVLGLKPVLRLIPISVRFRFLFFFFPCSSTLLGYTVTFSFFFLFKIIKIK